MNKEQAITTFVKDEYEFLLNKNFTQQKLKQEFQRRHGSRFGRIEPKDLVAPLVRRLKGNHIPPQNIKQYLETLPIFRNLSSGLLLELRQIAFDKHFSGGLSDEDLELIRKLDAIDAAKELEAVKRGAEESKRLQDIHRQIEEAKSEYENLPSVLDYEEVVEPEFDPATEAIKQWWERFYLRENPFPQGDGLSQIDEKLYEEVLVKTRPFQECLGSLKVEPNYLFDSGFLLCGDGGYGKTTFIDYLSYYLIQINILPIRITCEPAYSYVDSASFRVVFDLQLKEKLKNEVQKISEEKIELGELSAHSQVEALIRLITTKRWKGVVVFLDDYHKYPSEFEQIWEFLGQLQVLKNNLTRANLRVGFVVSGTTAWNRHLATDGHLRGFLDGTAIEMPEITPELVCEVFNQRLKAYCYDQSARRIKPWFVKQIFSELTGVGYRTYLNRIIEELKKNNLSIVDTPIEIDVKTLTEIRSVIESDPALLESINKLVYGSKFKRYTARQVDKCLELLIQTSIHEGINELDRLFDDNKYYFNRLRECSLIQKRRRKAADGFDTFDWVVHSRLHRVSEAVRNDFGFTINDYLLKVYAATSYSTRTVESQRRESELAEVIKFFDNRQLNHIPESALANIRTSLRLFDGLLIAENGTRPSDDQVSRAWDAFSMLSEAFFEIDESRRFFNDNHIMDVTDRWYFHPFDNETLLELLNRYEDYVVKPADKKTNASLVYKDLREVFPALAERLKIMVEDISDKTFFGLSCHLIQHTKAELALFERIRDGYFSAVGSSHYDYIRIATDYLETKLRKFLFATTSLVFGEQYHQQIPPALHKYARRNLESRTTFSTTENTYAGLTRGQIREIFDGTNNIKKFVCNFLNTGWTSDDWRSFIDEFVAASINSSHQQQEAYSPAHKDLYLNYCRKAEQLISTMNSVMRGITKTHTYLIHGGGDRALPDNYLFKYSFQPVKSKSEGGLMRVLDEVPDFITSPLIADNLLSNEVYRKVLSSLLYRIQAARRNSLVEDLLEIEYISNSYNVSYEEFIHSLAFAYFVDKKVLVQPWFGSSVILKQAVT